MNIRPKNNKILYADTGVKFSQNNLRGANWRQQVFNNYRQHLLDQLTKYGEKQDYGQWLNEMQSRHANIYSLAGGEKGNWENIAYKNDLVGQYQQDYRGGLGNDGQYKRFGSININPEDKYDFNQTGIKTNQGTRYNIANPPSRTSGDYSRDGYNYKVDNLYSAITDDRRLLGRKGDWDEASEDYKQWQKDLNARGWETYLDSDNYYKLRRLPNPDPKINPSNGQNPTQGTNQGTGGGIPASQRDDPESLWNKIGANLNKIAPDLLDALRLAGNMHNNERVYRESMKAIIPNLQQSYHTYRQVVGDEATKQAYYRRAAQGEQKAAQPFTADADRQVAYMNEAKRIGDELRAQGDLADNQRIRETSAESAAHADANTERDTAVANSNLTELIKAKAAKHQLTAQKYSADWTNLEQYLMGRQYKLEREKAKKENIEEQVKTLQMQDDIANDPDIKAAYDSLNNKAKQLFPNGNVDWNDSRLSEDIKNLQSVRRKAMIKYYTLYAKEGTKIERKRKDDSLKYLYRTSRDIVEHFRKMSKMTDDSRVRTMPKPIKLPSHPKKFQYGGVAPFTIYRPLGVGGESSYAQSITSSSGSGKSEKDTAAKDKLDMIKELFKSIKGLPVDVAKVYQDIMGTLNKAKAFGEELSTDDLASMYLSSMQKMAQLKYSEDAYEKAKALATQNEALNEIAVGTSGEMVFQNLNTGEYKIGTIGSKMFKDKEWNPLTNDQILELRAKSPNMVFNDQMFNIVNNGVGLNKISAEIKSLAAGLSTTDRKIEGISEVQNNRVKAGLQILAGVQGTPDGYYKVTQDSKSSKANVDAALNYIYSILPTNYKTILAIHSGSEENSKGLILKYLTSQAHDSYEESISPLTGKASDKDKKDTISATFNDLLQRGQVGIPREFSMITKDENTKLYSLDAKYISQLPKVNSDMSVDRMLAESEVGKILDSRLGITFGDQIVNPESLKDIMFSVGGGATVVTLPCKYENGHKVVNFAIKEEFDEAIKEASKSTPVDWTDNTFKQNLANILKQKGLDSLLTTGMQLDPNMLGQFLVVEGYSTDRVKFNKNSKYIEKVSNPTKELEERLSQALSTKGLDGKVQKYDVDINDWGLGFLFEGGWDDIYHANVFIPLNNDPISAQIGSSGLDRSEAKQLASEYQNYQKLIRAKNTDSNQL